MIIRSIIILLSLTVLLCGVYPLAVTVIGNILFRDKAQGSLIQKNGKTIGSELIGQSFTQAKYFQGRPSAAGEKGYDAANSSGSNLGPTSKKLMDRVKLEIERIRKENPKLANTPIPADLVTASGSGLDPHISPKAAQVQVARVAAARKLDEKEIQKLVNQFTKGPEIGLFGDPTVNVLLLNLELDRREHEK